MKHQGPPKWMEGLLQILVPARDRETVVGDLREEFNQRAGSQPKLWYMRQVVSFVPRRVRMMLVRPSALSLICAFTGLCACWLGAMNIRFGHPVSQLLIACLILAQSLLTLGALQFRQSAVLRYVAMLGCVPLLWLASRALEGIFTGAHNMEGYILLIALALVVQAVLTLGTLPGADGRAKRRA